jgi:hypothetical protein
MEQLLIILRYWETLPLLYSGNTFILTHLTTVSDLSLTVPSSHLSFIRTFHLHWTFRRPFYEISKSRLSHYTHSHEAHSDRHSCEICSSRSPYDEQTWEDTWQVIATYMKGLRELKVELRPKDSWFYDYKGLSMRLLKPLWDVKHVEHFEVTLMWTTSIDEDIEDGRWAREGKPFGLTILGSEIDREIGSG